LKKHAGSNRGCGDCVPASESRFKYRVLPQDNHESSPEVRRRCKGLSAVELFFQSHIKKPSLTNYEEGDKHMNRKTLEPSLSTLTKLADGLGLERVAPQDDPD
jgi:hypothetical protein